MYQMSSPYQPEVNHMYPHDQVFALAMQPSIQMSSFAQQIPQKASTYPCISWNLKNVSTGLPHFPSPISVCDYHCQPRTPVMNSPQIHSLINGQPTVMSPATLDNDFLWSCNFMWQLQGNYEIETSGEPDQISVIVPRVSAEEEQYAIVRRVCNDGEALPDQFIYEEPNWFKLCAVNGKPEAFLWKGCNMRFTVTWEHSDDGSPITWRRKGDVTFNLVYVDSLTSSRRNSICSMDSLSTSLSGCGDSPSLDSHGVPSNIRQDLFQQGLIPRSSSALIRAPSYGSLASVNSFQPNINSLSIDTSDGSDYEERAMFELMKAHCSRNSLLLEKMINWAGRNSAPCRLSPEHLSNLSEGRIFVTAHVADLSPDAELEESSQETLNDIKGAYRRVRRGVYKQPEPKLNEPGVQHRLSKDTFGHWKIEGYDNDTGNWDLCAKELPDGSWVNMKNNGGVIRVLLVPMIKILQKLADEFVCDNSEVEKNMEFLFTSCNQKKLISKLNGRNMNNHISNLQMKLEKQYALSFAVKVSTTADSIALEMEMAR